MVGFVLSGGASLGAVQVGMLRALYEREIVPELVVGASVGAINGAYIASHPPTVQTAYELAAIWRTLRTFQIFPPNPAPALLGLLGRLDHLISNAGLKAVLAAHFQQFERLEQMPIPLHVIATDIRDGSERRLSAGDVMAAVMASSAIPGIYPAVSFEGVDLVDGGVANNTPISDAAELGATKIYVLPTGISCELEEPPRAAIPVLIHAFTVLISQRLTEDIERFSHEAELIVLPPPCPTHVLPSDFSHAGVLIEQSYELARAALEHPDPATHWTPRSLERIKPHEH
ncbi:MAG: patatin-like phospholipase family protein [Actinomycetota bacterium]|nr:patatin-like phospholipase family protein [Actinomycetota bacterium]